MSKPRNSLLGVAETLSKHREPGLYTWPAMPLVLDELDGAAGKAILAAHKAIGKDCTSEQLCNALATAFWWLQTLVMMARGEAFAAELERLASEQKATDP